MPTLFSFDTETHLIQPGLAAPPLVCGSIASEATGSERLLSRDETRSWFREHIRSSRLVGTNLAYDLGVMCADDTRLVEDVFQALDEGRLHDVSIREALIDIARGQHGIDPKTGRRLEDDEGIRYSLALLAERYLGLDLSADKSGPDAWRLRYAHLEHVPLAEWPEAARDYPKRDARYTLDVFLAQERSAEHVPNRGNLLDEPSQVRAAWALRLMTLWGLRTNGSVVAQLRTRVEAEWERSREEFRKAGIYRLDGTKDTHRLAELVSAAYGSSPPRTPPTERHPDGQVATDRDTLIESGDALLERLGRGGKNDKYRSTYLPVVERGIQRPINPAFNVLVATGRCSSDYQQLPQKGGIRECHEARPGYVYCSVDYGGLELRTMAQRAIWEVGWSRMAEALLAGQDVHTLAAAEFLGVPYEELLPRVKAKEEVAVSFRALAKVFNFGKGGGLGAGGMAYNARAKDGVRFCLLAKRAERCGERRTQVFVQGKPKSVCEECITVARELGDKWLRAWPEQRELFARAGALTRNERLVEATVPVANLVRGGCGYTQWLNTPFQGLGAVGAKLATWRVSREMYTDRRSLLWGSRLVLMVHDELVSEMPEGRAPEAAERKAELMRQAMRETTPDLAGAIEAEPALSRILSKDAATVRDARGRLLVWEPSEKKAA